MELLYLIIVKLYGALISIASVYNRKAAQWVKGRRNWDKKITQQLQQHERRILFHCSSLGEFEQGRPVLEALRAQLPEHKIILTFFSPSGYEVRKNEPLADYVFYLPLDGPGNAKKFLQVTSPEMVFFVKYDFWHYYIKQSKDLKIPVYFVSSVFRPSQIFFKWYGKFFRTILKRVTHFFVQNQESLELLYKYSIPQVTVTGDTRFDRVFKNSLQVKSFPEIESFKGHSSLFIAGSTWSQDEKLIRKLIKGHGDLCKFIIVPHEVKPAHINTICTKIPGAVAYTKWNKTDDCHILVIDTIGMLSSLYQYADIAYIGGGFGKGIHNILEAAVFGTPVIFGPNYSKFREARDLIRWKGAFSISRYKELDSIFIDLITDEQKMQRAQKVNVKYINDNKGATDLIINYLKLNHQI